MPTPQLQQQLQPTQLLDRQQHPSSQPQRRTRHLTTITTDITTTIRIRSLALLTTRARIPASSSSNSTRAGSFAVARIRPLLAGTLLRATRTSFWQASSSATLFKARSQTVVREIGPTFGRILSSFGDCFTEYLAYAGRFFLTCRSRSGVSLSLLSSSTAPERTHVGILLHRLLSGPHFSGTFFGSEAGHV
jgi:hypothetical protein